MDAWIDREEHKIKDKTSMAMAMAMDKDDRGREMKAPEPAGEEDSRGGSVSSLKRTLGGDGWMEIDKEKAVEAFADGGENFPLAAKRFGSALIDLARGPAQSVGCLRVHTVRNGELYGLCRQNRS